jgi:uncharacterized Zn-binding protein involved in type VI secretion
VTYMLTEFCPDCEMPIRIAPRPRIGQRLTCPHCNTRLEVTEVSPLEFYWVIEGQPVAREGKDSKIAFAAGRR